jgi:hypothetical protein
MDEFCKIKERMPKLQSFTVTDQKRNHDQVFLAQMKMAIRLPQMRKMLVHQD